jgi:hypothetical protein
LELDVPKAPDPDEAEAAGALAQRISAQEMDAPYAHCFGCGIARSDGLRIVAGPVGDAGIVATSWVAPSFVADASGQLSVEAIWAALDCRWDGNHHRAHDGRKLHAGTAIFDVAGKVQARSRQLWLIQRA